MGLEDYTIRLKPNFNDTQVRDVLTTLVNYQFAALPPSRLVGGAELAEPPQDQMDFVRDAGAYIIEAQIKAEPEAKEFVRSVSVRLAVCQPEEATDNFQIIVCQLSHRHNMTIFDGSQEFDCLGLHGCGFCTVMEAHLNQRKARWRVLFEGDTEERPMRPGEAWHYFLDKHPHLRK